MDEIGDASIDKTNLSEVLDKSQFREIGNLATWSVSSWKQGLGIEAVRDDTLESYWQ